MISRDNKSDDQNQPEFSIPLFQSMQQMNQGLEDENIVLKKELNKLKATINSEISEITERLKLLQKKCDSL